MRSSSEAGFTLAGLIVLLTIMSVVIASTVPHQWSIATARDRDQQTLFAMKQYARAIQNFIEAKNNPAHAFPTSLDQLKQARNPRLMRGAGELIDPLTGKVDWIPVPPTPQQPQPGAPNIPGVTRRAGTPLPTVSAPVNPNQPGQPGGYVGPIGGVRPNKTGKSYLTLNGNDSYEQWSYTTIDLRNDITQRMNAMLVK